MLGYLFIHFNSGTCEISRQLNGRKGGYYDNLILID